MSKKPWDIKIVADMNDADYITQITNISDADLAKIRPLIAAIKAFKPYEVKLEGRSYAHTHRHNWPLGEYSPRTDLGEKSVEELYGGVVDADTLELFKELVPFAEHGVHSITSIEIAPTIKWERLL